MNHTGTRTTIRIPDDLHQQFRLLAAARGMTLTDVVVERLRGQKRQSAQELFALFAKARRSGKQLIARQAVREERDSH